MLTLTRNLMSVAKMELYGDTSPQVLDESIAVNSTAFLDAGSKVIGNPTEGALLLWLHDRGVDYAALRAGAAVTDQMSFTTERKYMATIIESGISGRRILCVKGAPEGFLVLSGDDAMTLPLMSVGGHGVISVIANAFPERFALMVHTAQKSVAQAQAIVQPQG